MSAPDWHHRQIKFCIMRHRPRLSPPMHFELPELPLQTLKDFAKHYFMIVVSILTALGLEQWIESIRHTHAAEAAKQRIEMEMDANLIEVRNAKKTNALRFAPLKKIEGIVSKGLLEKQPTAEILSRVKTEVGPFPMGVETPSLRHEAWDVAVANQSATWVDVASLQKYSRAYAAQRDCESGNSVSGARAVPSILQIAEVLQDAGTDEIDPRQILRDVRELALIEQSVQFNLDALERSLMQSLPEGMPQH